MKLFFIISFCFFTITAIAQTHITLAEVKDHVNDSVTVTAKIFGGKYLNSVKGRPTFLNVGGNYPNAPLTLVIWDNVRREFPEGPEQYYKGKEVVITGKIVMYTDKPEIVIDNATQIHLETVSKEP